VKSGTAKRWGVVALLVAVLAYCASDSEPAASDAGEVDSGLGDAVTAGDALGSADVVSTRDDPPVLEDDPDTANDESNDQPVGYYGTQTICVQSYESGNTYTLDAEVDGLEVTQIYFPRGGNLDFTGCELDENLEGQCEDDEGDTWEFQGQC
jgi:hypothetical protein